MSPETTNIRVEKKTTPKKHIKWIIALLLFLIIGCNLENPFVLLAVKNLFGPEALSFLLDLNPRRVQVFQEFKPDQDTVFTPQSPDSSSQFVVSTDIGPLAVEGAVDMSKLEQDGYLAIRVPHAPPTHTVSSILTPTVTFVYRTIPTDTQVTQPITITRRDEYLPAINAAFPIADNQSHWEVWWLPEGDTFPIPNEPFLLRSNDLPLRINYTIDFGAGANGADCAGCLLEYQLFNGFNFVGALKFPMLIQLNAGLSEKPLAVFDHCVQATKTIFVPITPTLPYTHEHCLSNRDTVPRTFTLELSSSENRAYTVFTQTTQFGSTPVPLMGNQITVPPDNFALEGIRILAVHTPTLTITDTSREVFVITATSTISPDVQTSATSLAFGPSYELNEAGSEAQNQIFLPAILKN